MSFDARSRERLEALGRQLPKKLPLPTPPAVPAGDAAPAGRAAERRHRVETEQDPERLFHELMDVSPDGTVPSHLLDRLRQLETPRNAAAAASAAQMAADSGSPQAPPGRRSPDRRPLKPRPTAGDPRQDLYTAFQQLLLEDED
ncbi:MAG: hypothetical protein ER33_01310 [Cyanobium sp. CACIAM 14]|nr:MAG: hypothetical protein ER33_01310 [Cyanobium sp. CACIAM 14]